MAWTTSRTGGREEEGYDSHLTTPSNSTSRSGLTRGYETTSGQRWGWSLGGTMLKKLAEADRAITRGPHGKALLLEIRLGERSAGLK